MLFLCGQAQDLKVFECVFGLLMGYLVIVLLINVCFVFTKPVNKQGANLITAIVGSRTRLPCNFPKLEPHDRVRLILWYREDIGTPIYSVDARDANFSMAGHWSEEKLFGRRASFEANNVSAALVVNGVKKGDEGFFRCRTDFLHAQTRNLVTQLQVVVPPRKVWLTRSDGAILSSVLEGLREEERLDLTCHAEGGDPSPRLLWLGDNIPINAAEEITLGDTRKLRLHINALQRHHSGVLLTCEASNSNLIQPVIASVKLGLHLRPIEVKIDDTTKHLSAGVEANLVCRAYGARPPPFFTWWMDNILKEELGVETSSQNETVSSIRFTPQITDRGKLIKCSVRQQNETILDPVDRMSIEYQLETTRLLFIHYKPIVTLRLGASLTPRQIKEGDDIYFDCIIDAMPLSYKILWFHNEQELHHNVSFGRIISNYSLAMQKIERKMSGKYACLAANFEGQTMSNTVLLDVLYSPVCKIQFTKAYGVGRHEEISILCEVESSPKDIKGFRWALNSTSNGKVTEIPFGNYTIDGSTSTLKYVPSSDVEFGTALCWARNIVGEQENPCVFQIVAAERPDPVRNCSLSNQSTDSLSFQCLEGFSGGLEQHFLLKVLASNGTVLRDNISSSTAAFSVRGLNPDSMFLLSVQAVNPKGRSDAVVSKVFTLRPPETQKNTEANSKSSKSGDFLAENSPLIGAITGAVLCLLLMTAPIILAFLRSIRSRRLEIERYPLDTISGATSVDCQVRDKQDVVPQKGKLKGEISLERFHHFHTPTESDILRKESTGSYGIIKSSTKSPIASTITELQLPDQPSFSRTKSYLNTLTEANYDYQKQESEV